jgi:hypothetical protein
MVKHLLGIVAMVFLFAVLTAPGFAARNPNGAGQPSQTCLESSTTAMEPGRSAGARGSAFNETSPGVAGTVYAGEGQTLNTPANDNAVSQYDVACYQVTSSH